MTTASQRPAAELSRALPDPRADELSDQQLAGGGARGGRPEPAKLLRVLGDRAACEPGKIRWWTLVADLGDLVAPLDRSAARARSSSSPT